MSSYNNWPSAGKVAGTFGTKALPWGLNSLNSFNHVHSNPMCFSSQTDSVYGNAAGASAAGSSVANPGSGYPYSLTNPSYSASDMASLSLQSKHDPGTGLSYSSVATGHSLFSTGHYGTVGANSAML